MTSHAASPLAGIAALAVCAGLAWPAVADPRATLRGNIDPALREQLVRAIGDVEGPPTNRFEARRRARSAAEAVEALLRSEGYYQPLVEDIVEGDEAPLAIVGVTPGRRFLVAAPRIEWIEPTPEPAAQALAGEDTGLAEGSPGRAVDVIAAEGRIVAGLSLRGYADAAAEPRRVVVDHVAFTVQPTYRIASGPLVLLDGVLVETLGPTSQRWVAGLVPWSGGDRYDPEQVAELERRLLETGVYDGVGVALATPDQTDAQGRRPVIVTLTDRPQRILEAGATFSTAEGSGLDLIWTQYNRFSRADTLTYELRAASVDSRLGVDLSLPHWRGPGRTLKLGASVVNEDTNAYQRTAVALSADLQERLGRTSYISYGVGLDAGKYDEGRFDPLTSMPVTFIRDLVILTGRGSAYWDQSNDPLNPTQGWRLTVGVQPTAVTGEDSVVFLRAEGQITAYMPLGENASTVVAGRARLGTILGGEELTVPSDRLFYSGGGGSVRGYEYQGVGPRLPDNTPRGGLSLFEASLEVRRDLGRNFGAVAFVDAGAIGFQTAPDFTNIRYGVGVGVRYNLPFGPVRADIAVPLDRREGDADFHIYVSIGQAF